jgi:hypothetical protein
VHNETLSVVAMRVSNPDCSPLAIQEAETGFAEIVGDYLPGLHWITSICITG